MCGIYGYQLKPGQELTAHEATVISLMLAQTMESRGKDSFGGVQIPTVDDVDKQAHIIRGLGRVSEVGTTLLERASNARSFLGHTRAATVGAVTIPNAHPFMIGDVLGVHNGCVQNWEELNLKYDREFAVDSMHLFGHINDGLPLDDIYGYGTLFWLRQSENWQTIYFARTMNGSLTVAYFYRDPNVTMNNSKEEPFLTVWASEQEPIRRIAKLLNFGWHSVFVETEKVHMIQNSTVFKTDTPFKIAGYYDRSKGRKAEIAPWGIMGEHFGRCHLVDSAKLPKHNKGLTRKQKKALRKKQNEAKKGEWVADPKPENVHSGAGRERIYVPINGKAGQTRTSYLCQECKCQLRDHTWSVCSHNGDPDFSCKGTQDQGCDANVQICSDCGHYLIAGIHDTSETPYWNMLECNICDGVCAPEAMIMEADKAREEELQQETEMAAAMGEDELDDICTHPQHRINNVSGVCLQCGKRVKMAAYDSKKPTEIILSATDRALLLAGNHSKEEEEKHLQILKEFNGTA
jgi:predicted glutamine amidotransferase